MGKSTSPLIFPGEALLCEEIFAHIDVDTALAAILPEIAAPSVEIRQALGVKEAWCNEVNKILTRPHAHTRRHSRLCASSSSVSIPISRAPFVACRRVSRRPPPGAQRY